MDIHPEWNDGYVGAVITHRKKVRKTVKSDIVCKLKKIRRRRRRKGYS